MATVPYSPVPSVAPSHEGQPNINVQTPGAAFGETVGRAIEGLGSSVSHIGNELFGRAVALQELKNATEAKDADAQYMIAIGKKHAEFSALEGKARVDAFDGYVKDLETTRVAMRQGLSNDASRRMFDSSALSTMSRTIFNGAGAAATAQKQWAIGSATSQLDLDTKAVEDDPKSDGVFQDKIRRVRESAANLSALKGFEEGGSQEKDLQLKAVSQLWSARIIGLSRTDPFEAARTLDQNKTELSQSDFLRVDNAVRAQSRAVGAANIAREVFTAGQPTDEAPAVSLKDMEDAARAKAKAMAPDDPILAQHAVSAVQGLFNQGKYATRQEELENVSIVNQAIMNGVRDERELRLDPKVAAAIDALSKAKQLGIPGQINRYNQARDKRTNQDNYQTIYGRSQNDIEAFLDTDLTKESLSQADIRKFQALQQKIKKAPDGGPKVQRAIGLIRSAMGAQLEALGIFRRTESNKDDYDHYTGAVSSALDIWAETKGKPPTPKEVIEEIGPQIIRQRAEPGTIFGSWWPNKEPFFRQTVPDKWGADFKADIVGKGGVEPTDEQVYRAYIRAQLINLYPGKKGEGK